MGIICSANDIWSSTSWRDAQAIELKSIKLATWADLTSYDLRRSDKVKVNYEGTYIRQKGLVNGKPWFMYGEGERSFKLYWKDGTWSLNKHLHYNIETGRWDVWTYNGQRRETDEKGRLISYYLKFVVRSRVAPVESEVIAMPDYSHFRSGPAANTCDVKILLSDDSEIEAHRMVLVNASPVLATMFGASSDTRAAEMREARTGEVEILDVDPDVMRMFVDCMYGVVPTEDMPLGQLMLLADRYGTTAIFQRLVAVACTRPLGSYEALQDAFGLLGKLQRKLGHRKELEPLRSRILEILKDDDYARKDLVEWVLEMM